MKVCRRAPGISHLLFADDTLLFFKADSEQAERVKHVLEIYDKGTGQVINPNKCSILFSPICPTSTQECIKGTLQITQATFEAKYLGLLTPDGRMSKGKLKSLQERLAKCLMEWEDNYLSMGGKEIKIKAIAQALPVYIMSVFKVPAGLCEELMRMIRRFWWGAEKGKWKTHWVSWDFMVRPEGKGGMGFKDLRTFNQALLARQAWRLIQFLESLCAQVLRAKYYPDGSILDTVFYRERIVNTERH